MNTTRGERSGGSRTRMLACAAVLVGAAGACLPALGQDDGRVRAQPNGSEQPPPETQQQPEQVPAPPAGELPPAAPAAQPAVATGQDEITLSDFPEAVELRALVEWVGETLGINIAASDQLTGSVVINAPITVKRDRLLHLLNALLEQQNFTIYYDNQSGWHRVVPAADVAPSFDDGMSTTRIIPTPGLRPSSLADMINQQVGGAAGGAGRQLRISYLDDLGIIVLTDTPRRIGTVQELVSRVLDRSRDQKFIRFELQHVAASVARNRVIELLGQAGSTPGVPGQPTPPAVAGATAAGVGLSDRLTVDPQGNALILRGHPEESVRIERALQVIDRPKLLEYRQYFAGSAATQIAELAQRQGLGTVETIESAAPTAAATPGQPARPPVQVPGFPGAAAPSTGGPMMIVDTSRGVIVYYGTASQQQHLAGLIKVFDTERELVVIMAYKVKNVAAEDVADLLGAMIGQQAQTTTSAFLPGGGRDRFGGRGRRDASGALGALGGLGTQTGANQRTTRPGATGVSAGAEGASPFGEGDVFVIADRANNQVLVKAPAKQQEEFAKLIGKLDQRRPQVYIEVQIVSVSASDDFQLAVETQLINANGTGGVVNTNFGLGTLSSTSGTGDDQTTTGGILSPKVVRTGLAGLTAAIIKSDQVPIVINALKRDTDTRILSSPQLLVDDNETAEIVSLEQQPTTTTSQGTATTIQTFNDFVDAGTRLLVTPSISEGGYMRLAYEVELSNFVGASTTAGVPPARQERSVNSDSVTIPGDTTIVVGGIKVDSDSTTIAKVPLLGDIPILGYLFRDTNKSASNTRLYVFITPRIMRDPNFRDLMLLTRGPQAESGIAPDVPELKPAVIEMVEPPPLSFQRGASGEQG